MGCIGWWLKSFLQYLIRFWRNSIGSSPLLLLPAQERIRPSAPLQERCRAARTCPVLWQWSNVASSILRGCLQRGHTPLCRLTRRSLNSLMSLLFSWGIATILVPLCLSSPLSSRADDLALIGTHHRIPCCGTLLVLLETSR